MDKYTVKDIKIKVIEKIFSVIIHGWRVFKQDKI